jgi:hypothetical protein
VTGAERQQQFVDEEWEQAAEVSPTRFIKQYDEFGRSIYIPAEELGAARRRSPRRKPSPKRSPPSARSLSPGADRAFDKSGAPTRTEVAARQLGVTAVISPAMQDIAKRRCENCMDVELVPSASVTTRGEADVWRQCLSWAVTKTKCRLVALCEGQVVGCCYYTLDKKASLAALAVLPVARGQRLGRLLIATSVAHSRRPHSNLRRCSPQD